MFTIHLMGNNNLLEKQYAVVNESKEVDSKNAGKCFESHFGEIDLCNLTGINNDLIDKDFAREYSDAQKEY